MMETDLTTIKRCVAHLIKEFDYQKKELKEKPLKELVTVVKCNRSVIAAFVDILFGHIRRDDCDVRLAVLFITNHFFQRSHNFRIELINSIQDFLIYTLETDPLRYPLPKPTEAAILLKKESLAILRLWIEKFGPGYGKLEKLQNFLKSSKSIDWENSRVELSIDRERESREQFQRAIKTRKVVENISNLFEGSRPEISRLLVESQSVVEMIFPKFCPLDGKELAASTSSLRNSKEQLHGFGLTNALTISLNAMESNLERNYENEALFNQLDDTTAQLEIWWLKKLASVGDSSEMMRRVIDARQSLGEDLQKCRELRGKRTTGRESSGEEEDDDADFVDVEEKEGYEPDFSAESHQSAEKEEIYKTLFDCRPGPSGLSVSNGPKDVSSVCESLRWDSTLSHHFWSRIDDDADNVPTENMEAYRSRQITFVGEMLPLKRRCHAPLPSGKLCPRMERERCALHGPIIDRDESGFPQKERNDDEKEHLLEESSAETDKEEENELDFLRDVEEATGIKLTTDGVKKPVKRRKKKKVATKRKKKGKRKKKTVRERPKPKSVKSRERLVAKLFDKRTLKRVTKTLDQMQKARAQRKFSSQFNYALERR
uniref:UV-stimulated scaffold protein A n=1 Tax=Globodera pallida TaxID=36090 RepID=A0A183C4M2_GLOPA